MRTGASKDRPVLLFGCVHEVRLDVSLFKGAVNLKTAKLLGVSVPLSVIGRADEVIE
jgi:hypothetical protein